MSETCLLFGKIVISDPIKVCDFDCVVKIFKLMIRNT